jgi:uncharacterized membrane protein YhaH (DUF805 family)
MRLRDALFSFEGTIGRRTYLLIAFVGVILKHTIDLFVANAFGRSWDATHYLIPLGVPVSIGNLSGENLRFLVTMVAIAIPFAYVGLAITTRRFRTIGWPLWLVVLFFVPIANIASFAVAAAWPDRRLQEAGSADSAIARVVPRDALGSAVLATLVSGLLGAALVPIGTLVLGSYGWGLFAAIPFAQGAIAAYLYSIHRERTVGQCVFVALLSVTVTCAALLALAVEGVVCIAMAAPIAGAFAAIGALFGYAVGRPRVRPNAAAIVLCMLFAPAIMGAEKIASPVAPTYEVSTSIDIAAPPSEVWKHVIRFPDLPPPTELPFRVGVAYPIRAKIVGEGVGAVRYCQFSTGDFVEPITIWNPGHELAFSVRTSAEPMHELSPYGSIDTPHLHDYMVSRHGQFVLEALPNGGTRLIGSTWYQHHLWPASYWRLWSDAIVHDIHYRVLEHIKNISERDSEKRAPIGARFLFAME